MKSKALLDAVSFASRKHDGQIRKDGRTPYASHPVRVAWILATEFGVQDEEVLTAAVLHDTIEDTTVDRDDISERYGERVASYVALLSQDTRLPEAERERAYFDALTVAPAEVRLCKLADVYDNLLDSHALDAAGRGRALRRARELLARFRPGLEAEWGSVLAALEAVLEEASA